MIYKSKHKSICVKGMNISFPITLCLHVRCMRLQWLRPLFIIYIRYHSKNESVAKITRHIRV